jgi:precorrin-8X/cobalt-precorrin-8 methylmutase
LIINPVEIEKKSFEIINKEIKKYSIEKKNMETITRIIHTTTDFDYANITEIHEDAIDKGINAIRNGYNIYVDTNMIYAGINKKKLETFGSKIYSFIDDEEVIEIAEERGTTRSIVGIEFAAKDPSIRVFVIGNAPTALFKLNELIINNKIKPELIIGVPVGFVGAEESKEEIKKRGIPYIVTNGKKGGSTVAVAIINSLINQA